jgi:hypothetical protein
MEALVIFKPRQHPLHKFTSPETLKRKKSIIFSHQIPEQVISLPLKCAGSGAGKKLIQVFFK